MGSVLSLVVLAGLVGIGVPEADGGQLGGAAAPGPEAVLANPAAAVADPGVFLDVGYIYAGPSWTRAGLDPQTNQPYSTVGYRGPAHSGSTALVVTPTEFWGFGAGVHFPFGRGGEYPEDGHQRFHSVASAFKVMQVTGATAVEPVEGLRLGVGLHYMHTDVSGRVKTDIATTLYSVDPSTAPPFGEPLLEGEASLLEGSGRAFTWSAGAQIDIQKKVTIATSFQPAVPMQLTGSSMIRPSDDLAYVAYGRFEYDLTLPWIARAAVRWQVEHNMALRLEVQRTGWSAFSNASVRFLDMQADTSNAELSALLSVVGMQDLESLLNINKNSVRGMRNTWSGKAVGSFVLPRDWAVHTLLGWEQHSIAAELAHPGNIDWSSVYGGLALERSFAERWRVTLSSTQYFGKPRVVTSSIYDQTHPTQSGLALPPSNGVYEVFFHRSSITLAYRW